VPDHCPVLDWAASGGMALTGLADWRPLASAAGAFGLLQQVTDELAAVTRAAGREVRADPAELIAGRAALAGFTRRGQVSAGGSTRLLRSADGWCAVTMSRIADLESVPAILGMLGIVHQPFGQGSSLDATRAAAWSALTSAAGSRPATEVADAAQVLAVPAGALPPTPEPAPWPPWHATRIAPSGPAPAALAGAVVVDLSAMWAGPLCARLLGLAGAKVIKIESPDRPDGARSGDQRFYDWLHAGHKSASFPFRTGPPRAALSSLLARADVVIESSRPRALAGLGVAPGMIAHKPGQVWLSITGYGRDEPDRVAFGDDAAIAGGLADWTGGLTTDGRGQGDPVFCADAIADPLTGACGALAVARSLMAGGGELIDLPMRAVAASFAAAANWPAHGEHELRPGSPGSRPYVAVRSDDAMCSDGAVRSDGAVWCSALGRSQRVLPPRAPAVAPRAARLGADTEAVLAWLGPA
jgi:crotonobetainyl-CoA:carnitine CoA-transferase CaiB-like acyl-CoA transferase